MIMECGRKQEEHCLQHLVDMVQLTTSKTKLQLDEQITMVSDAAFNVKYLPQQKFWKVVPKVKSYLQKSLNLQKSIQQMLQEYTNYTKLDHWDLESICKSDKCPLVRWPSYENRENLTGELNIASQYSDLNIKRDDVKAISKHLVPYNGESNDVQYLNKDVAVQTSGAELEHLTCSENFPRISPVIDISKFGKEEITSLKKHHKAPYKECDSHDHISTTQDMVTEATYQVWKTKPIVDSVDANSSRYHLDKSAYCDTLQTINSAADSIPLNRLLNVYACAYEPSKKLWIQFPNSGLEELQKDLNQVVHGQIDDCFPKLYPGQRAAAPFKDDGCYYRAQVLQYFAKEDAMKVHFIDYGNCRKVLIKDLRPLPPRLAELPEMATCCSIVQIDDELLSDEAGYEHHNWLKKINFHIINNLPVAAILEKNEHARDVIDLLNYSLHCPRYKIRLFTQNYNLSKIQLNTDKNKRDTIPANSRNHSEISIGGDSCKSNDEKTTNIVKSVKSSRKACSFNVEDQHNMYDKEITNSGKDQAAIGTTCSTPEQHSLSVIGSINNQENTVIRKESLEKPDLDENCNHTITESESDSSSVVPLGALPFVTLPSSQPPLDGQPQAVMLAHVNTPSHFYLHLVNSESASLDRFRETMNDKYKDDDETLRVIELPVGSCWAAKWTDGMWYRASILANIISSSKKSLREKCPKVKVLFVDYGDEAVVDIKDIRFLHEDFTLLPSLAVPCCLAQVYPPSQNIIGCDWPSNSVKKFLDLCGGTWSVLFANFQQCHLSGKYIIILRDSSGVLVNEALVAEGFAESNSTSQESDCSKSQQNCKGLEGIREAEEKIPKGWDPMSSAYLSHKNTVHHNDECAETVLYGIKNTDETRLCKFFRNGRRCPRREACRWEHTRKGNGVTVEKETVFQDCLDPQILALDGAILAVVVTSIITPAMFYIYLPFGTKSLQQETDFADETFRQLDLLLTAMQEYYKASRQTNKCLPARGELMALCELKNGRLECSRVRVLAVKEEECVSQVQVFFIDFGYMEWVPEDRLHPLAIQFMHTPPQALECWLSGVKTPYRGWNASAARYLKELTEGHTLVAHVNCVDRVRQRLGVTLHNTDDGQEININKCVMKQLGNN